MSCPAHAAPTDDAPLSPARAPTPGVRFEPPRPRSEPSRASAFRKLLIGRGNILSAMNARMYRGWMGRVSLGLHRSFFVNQPDLVRRIFAERPDDFPKHAVVARGLGSLLGNSIFVTNGETWRRQRRMIDPAFAGGRLREAFPPMWAAAETMLTRLDPMADGRSQAVDAEMSRFAADVIFRTLFSQPISSGAAGLVFDALARYQRAAPFVSLRYVIGAPGFWRRWFPSEVERAGADIRALLTPLVAARRAEIADGRAPDDLCTALIQARDPDTGAAFDDEELVAQIASFFLAGHETSASALAWALYLIANDPPVQDRMRAEIAEAIGDRPPVFADLRALPFTRDVLRETLRLYPPIPFVARQAGCPAEFRGDRVPKGASIFISAWFLQRHERIWDAPHRFDPDRWAGDAGKAQAREAYIPFTTGARSCVGAGFAIQEGVLALAALIRRYRFEPVEGADPEPVAQVTLRAGDGIHLRLAPADPENLS